MARSFGASEDFGDLIEALNSVQRALEDNTDAQEDSTPNAMGPQANIPGIIRHSVTNPFSGSIAARTPSFGLPASPMMGVGEVAMNRLGFGAYTGLGNRAGLAGVGVMAGIGATDILTRGTARFTDPDRSTGGVESVNTIRDVTGGIPGVGGAAQTLLNISGIQEAANVSKRVFDRNMAYERHILESGITDIDPAERRARIEASFRLEDRIEQYKKSLRGDVAEQEGPGLNVIRQAVSATGGLLITGANPFGGFINSMNEAAKAVENFNRAFRRRGR